MFHLLQFEETFFFVFALLHKFLQKSHLRQEKSAINYAQYKSEKFIEDFSISIFFSFNNKNPRLNLFERHTCFFLVHYYTKYVLHF